MSRNGRIYPIKGLVTGEQEEGSSKVGPLLKGGSLFVAGFFFTLTHFGWIFFSQMAWMDHFFSEMVWVEFFSQRWLGWNYFLLRDGLTGLF